MSFIQCKDEKEVEAKLEEIGFKGFITEDHRIYDKVDFSDDACFYDLDRDTLLALYELQTSIEMVMGGMHEMPFQDVVKDAQMLHDNFQKTLQQIKFKPLVKKEKKK